MLLSLWRRTFYFSLSSRSNLGAKTASSSVRWMWLSSTPGGSWSVTLTSLTVPNSRRGQHSPCGGGRSLSPWATPLSMVTVGIVESLFVLTLACQSSCVLTRISRFRLWASFLRIWLRSFSFANYHSNGIWRFFWSFCLSYRYSHIGSVLDLLESSAGGAVVCILDLPEGSAG